MRDEFGQGWAWGEGYVFYPVPPAPKKCWWMEKWWLDLNEWKQKQRVTGSNFVVQSLSHVRLFATSWTTACQASLSFTITWSLLKLMSIESAMSSNHLFFCHPLLLLPSILPSIGVFSNQSALRIRGPKYWSFSISPSNEYSELISFRIDWFGLLAVQGTLKRFYFPKFVFIHPHQIFVFSMKCQTTPLLWQASYWLKFLILLQMWWSWHLPYFLFKQLISQLRSRALYLFFY